MPLIVRNNGTRIATSKGLSATTTTGTAPATYDFWGALGSTAVNIIGSVVPSVLTAGSQTSLIEAQQKLATVQAQNSQIIADMQEKTQTAQLQQLAIQSETEKVKQLSQITTVVVVGGIILAGGYFIFKNKRGR